MIKPKRASNNSASRLTRLYQASRSTMWKKIARNRSSLLFSRDESANNASSDQLKRKISLIVKIRTNSNDTITFIFKLLLTRVFDTHFIDNLSTSENKKCSLESIQEGDRRVYRWNLRTTTRSLNKRSWCIASGPKLVPRTCNVSTLNTRELSDR